MVEQVSDFKMPEKIVTRLLRDALPEDVTLSKDAKNAACRFAGIFLLQLSMAAAERAQIAKRRSLDNQDILKAMAELGLPECVPQLVRFGAQRKRNAKRKESNMMKVKSKKSSATEGDQQLNETLSSETNDEMPSMDETGDHDLGQEHEDDTKMMDLNESSSLQQDDEENENGGDEDENGGDDDEND